MNCIQYRAVTCSSASQFTGAGRKVLRASSIPPVGALNMPISDMLCEPVRPSILEKIASKKHVSPSIVVVTCLMVAAFLFISFSRAVSVSDSGVVPVPMAM